MVFFTLFNIPCSMSWASQVVLVVKNPPANTGDLRDVGLIPGSGRSPGGRHGNPLQYSCLGNPMDRGALWLQSIESQRVGHSTSKSWNCPRGPHKLSYLPIFTSLLFEPSLPFLLFADCYKPVALIIPLPFKSDSCLWLFSLGLTGRTNTRVVFLEGSWLSLSKQYKVLSQTSRVSRLLLALEPCLHLLLWAVSGGETEWWVTKNTSDNCPFLEKSLTC